MTREALDETVDLVASAICREKCAFYGDPPCWRVSDEWPNPHCNEPGCVDLAHAAIAAMRYLETPE